MKTKSPPAGHRIKNSTLLWTFIGDRLNHYVEPTRKGTPKGDNIGFSRDKFGAALLALFRLNKKEIAALLKVPYGVVRNWHTEREVQNLIELNRHEFARFFLESLDSLLDSSKEQDTSSPKYLSEMKIWDDALWAEILNLAQCEAANAVGKGAFSESFRNINRLSFIACRAALAIGAQDALRPIMLRVAAFNTDAVLKILQKCVAEGSTIPPETVILVQSVSRLLNELALSGETSPKRGPQRGVKAHDRK